MATVSSAVPRTVARASTMLATKRCAAALVPRAASVVTMKTTMAASTMRIGRVKAFGGASSARATASFVTRAVTEAEKADGILPKREPEDDDETDGKEFDIFRDSALRYMGYANEVGESFVAWVPAWGVPATYGVAATYV